VRPAVLLRACTVCAIILTGIARVLVRLVSVRRSERARVVSTVVTETLVQLGPAFIKAGQLLGTRIDVLPRSVCAALARLYDGLPVAPVADAMPNLSPRLLADLDGTPVPVAAGSIAYVYRARSRDGHDWAIKVRRPGVASLIDHDLVLFGAIAATLQRLPFLRGAPLVEIATQLGEAIRQQLDLAAEADALRLLHNNLTGPGIRVPAVVDAHSGRDVLVMEYIDGLHRCPMEPAAARRAALNALHAVYRMLFLDGFVHCDLHPGNLYPMPDGSAVIVDAGFSRQLPESARRRFASFFYHMSRGDGQACADLVLSTARPGASADQTGFRSRMSELVEQSSRATVAEFNLVEFAVRLFDVQRTHGYYAEPRFVFPILSLIVLEGSLRQACPDVDFQIEAVPFVLRGLMR